MTYLKANALDARRERAVANAHLTERHGQADRHRCEENPCLSSGLAGQLVIVMTKRQKERAIEPCRRRSERLPLSPLAKPEKKPREVAGIKLATTPGHLVRVVVRAPQ